MASRPTAIPAQLTAGDSWVWERLLSDYPADDGWALSYGIVGELAIEWDEDWVTTDGALFIVTIPMATTAGLPRGGSYRFVEMVTKAQERQTLCTEVRIVAADPAQFAPGDGVSWARRMVAKIEAFLEGHLEDGIQYEMIGTRQLQHIPLPELNAFLNKMRDKVAAERGSKNGPLGRPVRFAFPGA
jgi:hypothetical protein